MAQDSCIHNEDVSRGTTIRYYFFLLIDGSGGEPTPPSSLHLPQAEGGRCGGRTMTHVGCYRHQERPSAMESTLDGDWQLTTSPTTCSLGTVSYVELERTRIPHRKASVMSSEGVQWLTTTNYQLLVALNNSFVQGCHNVLMTIFSKPSK